MEYMRCLFPELEGLVKEALRKGLPVPNNWGDRWDRDEIAAENEAATDSVQGPNDPDEKEVREDCGSQTTEDCHGGNEATRSIEESPSVAENGQEDRDSDQTENGGEEGEGEGEDGQAGETTHSSDNGNDSGENGSGSGEGGEGTDSSEESDEQPSEDGSTSDSTGSDENGTGSAAEENQDTSEQESDDEVERDTTEVNSRLARLQASLGLLEQNVTSEERYDMETPEEKQTMQNIYNCIVEICKSACKGVKNQQTKWDTRAMARDICCLRRDRVLRDKHWSHKPRKLAIFWDQSGSCDFYFAAVANAIKEVAKLGFRCWLYDCSNGLAYRKSIVTRLTGSGQILLDPYNNGQRLKKIAQEVKAETDKIYIQPNEADFIKICQNFDVAIVIQDYDNVESVFLAAAKIPAKKCPHFIDVDSRYHHPCGHNWNPHLTSRSDYPVHDRWHKVVEVVEDE